MTSILQSTLELHGGSIHYGIDPCIYWSAVPSYAHSHCFVRRCRYLYCYISRWFLVSIILDAEQRLEVRGFWLEGRGEGKGGWNTRDSLFRSVRLWSKNWIVVIERMDREGIGKKWEWKWLRYGRNGMDCSGLLLIIRIKIDCWRRLRGNESIDKLWMDVVKRQPNKVRGYCGIRKGNEITGRYDRYRDREKVHFRWLQFSHQSICKSISSRTIILNSYFECRLRMMIIICVQLKGMGLRSGDCVAIYMENSTDFIAAWMGMAKVSEGRENNGRMKEQETPLFNIDWRLSNITCGTI